MKKTLWRIAALTLLLGAVTFGCSKPLVQQQKTPPDPLLISKKPIEGKPAGGDPSLATRIDPQPPPLPPRREVPSAWDRVTQNER
jgi:hypothetical protein